MATGLGFPAIPTPGRLDLRALQTAITNARQRIEQLERQLGIITSSVQQSSQSGVASLQQLIQQLAALAARVTVLENAASTDIGNFLAGDDITIGTGVVPLTSITVAQADPSDPTRIFGLIGVALNTVVAGQTVQVQRRGVYAPPGLTGLEVGRAVYADAVGLTQTPEYDATALPVGVAVSTTSIFIAPDFPALQYPAFSSGFADAYQNYMPVTYRMLQDIGSLEGMINALPYQSGADPNMLVPVTLFGTAVTVLAGDIAALAGLAVDLAALIDALPFQSGAHPDMMVPVTYGGFGYRVAASAIASLSFSGILAVSQGGTSLSTLTANNVILGNGTSAPTFVAPGTSGNVLTSNGTTWTSAAATGGITGFTSALNASGTNNTINNSSLTASGGTTSQGITLAWKGSGGYLNLTTPDGAAAGGNVPGATTVDFQFNRAAAGQVAAMNNSAQIGTSSSTTTGGGGGYCVNIAGSTLSTGGTRSLNTGLSNVSTGDQVLSHGGYGDDRGATCTVFGGGYGTAGGVQTRTFELWTASAFSAAAKTLTANGSSSPGATNIPVLPNTSIGTIIAYVAMYGGTDYWMVKLEGICYRNANAASTLINGVATAITGTVVYQTAGVAGLAWAVDMIADTTNGGVNVRTYGDAGQLVRSRCWLIFGELDP